MFGVAPTAAAIAAVLDRLAIPYAVGGGVASAFYGEMRMTRDVDIAVRLRPQDVDRFCALAEPEFDLDRAALLAAARDRGLVQVFHRRELVQVDLHVVSSEGHHGVELERARWVRLDRGSEDEVRMATPEDVVLQKLVWYRKGDEQSDRQLRDVIGILKARGASMDVGYMRHWGLELAVGDLVERVLAQSGIPGRPSADP